MRLFTLFSLLVVNFSTVFGIEPESSNSPSLSNPIPAPTRTDSEARVITLRVPAPRGKILDIQSNVLVENKIWYYLFIQLPWEPTASQETNTQALIDYVRTHSEWASRVLKKEISYSVDNLKKHLENRRWLPFSLGIYLKEDSFEQFQTHVKRAGKDSALWVLQPVYLRNYPHKSLASHILGTTGKRAPLSVGPLITAHTVNETELDPLFEDQEGRSGVEKSLDAKLRGSDGLIEIYVDRFGRETGRSVLKEPKPGKDVKLNIDLEWQRLAEKLLIESKKSSALVVLDLKNQSIPVLASYPNYDLSDFVPYISQEKFTKLVNNSSEPLLPRAWKGSYPPGSVFKVVTAMASLKENIFDIPWGTNLGLDLERIVKEKTLLSCPAYFRVRNRDFPNGNRLSEGNLSIYEAMMLSCNTWFYPVGLELGGEKILSMAQSLGLGRSTGLELLEEDSPKLPFKKKYDPMEVASMAIGQQDLKISPIQMARMVAAAIEKGQIRNFSLGEDFKNPIIPNKSHITEEMSEVLKGSMYLVVNGERGLAKAAAHSLAIMSGKTGTAEWGPKSQKKTIAWFAGFFPYYQPRYAFAVMLEGSRYQAQSGGKSAAPIIGKFFKSVIKASSLSEIQKNLSPPISDDLTTEPFEFEMTYEDPAYNPFEEKRNREAQLKREQEESMSEGNFAQAEYDSDAAPPARVDIPEEIRIKPLKENKQDARNYHRGGDLDETMPFSSDRENKMDEPPVKSTDKTKPVPAAPKPKRAKVAPHPELD